MNQRNEWRCRSCQALLGVARGAQLDVRHKLAHYLVRGRVTAVCRRCSTSNEMTTEVLASAMKTE